MNKINDAKRILRALNMPEKQCSDLCCYTLLGLLNLAHEDNWANCSNQWLRIHDIICFIKNNYHIIYAENSRETFRKQAIHHFRNAAIIEDNGLATNSPNYKYRITSEALSLFKKYNTNNWDEALTLYQSNHESLISLYSSKKQMQMMPISIDGIDFTLSSGEHNILQKAIIEEFAPRFAPDCCCLYIGDTINKDLVKNDELLERLGFNISIHDKMPDVVLYRQDVNWIYFIEAVTSVGPMSQKRINEIEKMTENVSCGKIYITAFPDLKTFKKFAEEIAWETEVWLAEMPEHMIHLNGDRFMGPR